MAVYKEKKYSVWPNPERFIRLIKNYFEVGCHSVEIIYNDVDNSLIIRVWDSPAYSIENHELLPNLD